MATTTYTPNAKLGNPGVGDTNPYPPIITATLLALDGTAAIGALCVTEHEIPSASLLIDVAVGNYLSQGNVVTAFAGVSGVAVTASAVTSVYLTSAGVLTLSTSGFPAAPTLYVPLANVHAGTSTILTIADQRPVFPVVGLGYLPLSGGTLSDGANLALGSTNGTKIGTATTQKIGFLGSAPVAQQTGGATTASGSYTSVEQGMLQRAYNCLRTFGLLS